MHPSNTILHSRMSVCTTYIMYKYSHPHTFTQQYLLWTLNISICPKRENKLFVSGSYYVFWIYVYGKKKGRHCHWPEGHRTFCLFYILFFRPASIQERHKIRLLSECIRPCSVCIAYSTKNHLLFGEFDSTLHSAGLYDVTRILIA